VDHTYYEVEHAVEAELVPAHSQTIPT
jgi:hypothetical protein